MRDLVHVIAALLNAIAGCVQESNAPVHAVASLVVEADARLDEVAALLHEPAAHLRELARSSPETRGLVKEVGRRSLSIPSEPNAPCASSRAEASMVRQDDRGVVRRELVEKLAAMQRARLIGVGVFALCFFGAALLAHATSGWMVLLFVPVVAAFVPRATFRCCPRCTQPLWTAQSPKPFAPRCCTGCDLILAGERRGETYVEPRVVVERERIASHDEELEIIDDADNDPVAPMPSPVDAELARLEAGGSPYRGAAPLELAPTTDRYLAAWDWLAASRNRIGWGAFLGATAAILGGGLLSLVSQGAASAFVAMDVLAVVIGLASQRFSCPRCKKPFFRDGKQRLPPVTACVHCGLRIGAREADERATDGLAAPNHAEK